MQGKGSFSQSADVKKARLRQASCDPIDPVELNADVEADLAAIADLEELVEIETGVDLGAG